MLSLFFIMFKPNASGVMALNKFLIDRVCWHTTFIICMCRQGPRIRRDER